MQAQQQNQGNPEVTIRFNISSHLRGVEAEIDGLHGMLLQANAKIADLEKQLSEAKTKDAEAKKK